MKKIKVQKTDLLNYKDGINMIVELYELAKNQGFIDEDIRI